MTTREYLGKIKYLDKKIQNKLAEISKLKMMACSVSLATDNDRVQKSSDKDKIGNFVAKIIQYEEDCEKLTEKRAHIVNQIETIEGADIYDVLAKRYILHKPEAEIAVDMYMSERNVRRLLSSGHFQFEKKYGNEYLSL